MANRDVMDVFGKLYENSLVQNHFSMKINYKKNNHINLGEPLTIFLAKNQEKGINQTIGMDIGRICRELDVDFSKLERTKNPFNIIKPDYLWEEEINDKKNNFSIRTYTPKVCLDNHQYGAGMIINGQIVIQDWNNNKASIYFLDNLSFLHNVRTDIFRFVNERNVTFTYLHTYARLVESEPNRDKNFALKINSESETYNHKFLQNKPEENYHPDMQAKMLKECYADALPQLDMFVKREIDSSKK